MSRATIGLLITIVGALIITLTIVITYDWSMEHLAPIMVFEFLGGFLVLTGFILLIIHLVSWLKRRGR